MGKLHKGIKRTFGKTSPNKKKKTFACTMLSLENFYDNVACVQQLKSYRNQLAVAYKLDDSYFGPQIKHAEVKLTNSSVPNVRVKLTCPANRLNERPGMDGKKQRSILVRHSDHANVVNLVKFFDQIGENVAISHPTAWGYEGAQYKPLQAIPSSADPYGPSIAVFWNVPSDVQCFQLDAKTHKPVPCKLKDILNQHGNLTYELRFDQINVNTEKKQFYWKPTVVGIVYERTAQKELSLLSEWS
jgi:hypothetical protein